MWFSTFPVVHVFRWSLSRAGIVRQLKTEEAPLEL